MYETFQGIHAENLLNGRLAKTFLLNFLKHACLDQADIAQSCQSIHGVPETCIIAGQFNTNYRCIVLSAKQCFSA